MFISELKTVKEIQEDVESLKTKCEEYDKLIEESRKNISQYVEMELDQSGNLYDWFKGINKNFLFCHLLLILMIF